MRCTPGGGKGGADGDRVAARPDLSSGAAPVSMQSETAHEGRLRREDHHQKPHDPAGPWRVGLGGSHSTRSGSRLLNLAMCVSTRS